MPEIHTPWTDAERATLRRLRRNNIRLQDISRQLKRSRGSIQRQIAYLGLPRINQREVQAPPPPQREPPPRAGRTTLPPLPSLRDQ